jgi:hypothetical protein
MTLGRFYRLTWLGTPLMVAIVLIYRCGHPELALSILIPLSLLGAVAGVMVQFRHLPGRCDLCHRPAKLIARYQSGFDNRIMLSSESCGRVVNAARFGVRIERLSAAGK